jgi:hypothetical protein
LLITALQIEAATFPPPADVNMMHMFTVVGKHDIMSNPSTRAGGKRFGAAVVKRDFRGRPIKNGHIPNIATWIRLFSFTFETAFVNSEPCSDRPESRKISPTPYFPMKSSGRRRPLSTPNC